MPRATRTELPPDFLDWLSCLLKARARFVVVGGHAVAVAGRPRYTEDLDVLVEPTPENAARVARALREFGFPRHADAVRVEFALPKRMATLGVKPMQIDVMTSIDGVTFADAWRGRKVASAAGRRIPFLGVEQLLANKRAAARDKDLLDVANLEELLAARRRPRPPRTRRRRR